MATQNRDLAPVVLITGAAGGIGKALTTLFGEKGYRLALADIHQPGLEEAKSATNAESLTFNVDVTDREQVKTMISDINSRMGRLDALINNVGTIVTEPFADCDVDLLLKENSVNYLSALYCIKEALPYMLKAGTGSIVSIASLGGILPMSVSPGYSASKAALRGLTLSLHLAFKPRGIHFGCVSPSAVDNEMLYHEATSGGSTLNFLQNPLPPEAVAKAVWRSICQKKIEICVPWDEGISSKFGGFFPSVLPRLLPPLEKWGDRNRLKYLKRKQASQTEKSS